MAAKSRRALPALIFANLLWGGSYVAARRALDELSPPVVAFMRLAPAVPVMFAYMVWRRQSLRLSVRDAAAYALLGVLGFAASKYIQYTGLSQSTAVSGALLVIFEAILTMLAAVVFLGEHLTSRKLVSATLGVLGVCLVARVRPWEGMAALADAEVRGNLLMVLALCCEAGYTIWGATLMRNHDPFRASTWSIFFAVLLLAPTLPPGTLAELGGASGGTWAVLLFLGVGPTAVAYTLWLAVARHMEAGHMAVTLYVQPLSGVIIAMLLLGESLTWTALLGGAVLFGAVQFAAAGAPRAD